MVGRRRVLLISDEFVPTGLGGLRNFVYLIAFPQDGAECVGSRH